MTICPTDEEFNASPINKPAVAAEPMSPRLVHLAVPPSLLSKVDVTSRVGSFQQMLVKPEQSLP
jgi:hypothetical protein